MPNPETLRTLSGPVDHFLDSKVDCPLAGLGQRSDRDCHRIALLDDHTTATYAEAAERLTILTTAPPGVDIAEIFYLGRATAADGIERPSGLHLLVRTASTGATLTARVHVSVPGVPSSVSIFAPAIFVDTPVKGKQKLLTPARAREYLANPPRSAYSVIVGSLEHVPPLPVTKKLMAGLEETGPGGTRRLELLSIKSKNLQLLASERLLGEMLAEGLWEFRLTAPTGQLDMPAFRAMVSAMDAEHLSPFKHMLSEGLSQTGSFEVRLRPDVSMLLLKRPQKDVEFKEHAVKLRITNSHELARAFFEFDPVGLRMLEALRYQRARIIAAFELLKRQ